MQIEFPRQTIQSSGLSFDKKKVAIGVAGALLFILLFALRFGGDDKGRLSDFFAMHTQAGLLAKGDADLEKLATLVKEHREVAPFFDAALIQSYFLSDEAGKANLVEERALKRLKYMDESYIEFAKGSILIEQGEKEKALEGALRLQEKIEGKKEFAKMAFFNLVRIGFLEETLTGKGKQTWERALNFLSPENEMIDESLRKALISHLSDGKSTVFDFLNSRH